MKSPHLRLCLVDDDDAIRSSLQLAMCEANIPFSGFASGRDFLEADLAGVGCILLNEHMPGLRGSDVQARLRERGDVIPVIFLTGAAEVSFVVRVVHAGA